MTPGERDRIKAAARATSAQIAATRGPIPEHIVREVIRPALVKARTKRPA